MWTVIGVVVGVGFILFAMSRDIRDETNAEFERRKKDDDVDRRIRAIEKTLDQIEQQLTVLECR